MRICYVNPTRLLKRPIAELSSRMHASADVSVMLPKKLFGRIDNSLHHSTLVQKSDTYTYGTWNPPLGAEQPLPLTPMFLINVFRMFRENDIVHMWVPYYASNFTILFIKRWFFPKKKLILTMDTIPGYSFSMGSRLDRLFRWYTRTFRKLLFDTPDVITLYGKSLLPYARQAGMPLKKVRVLPTGITLKKRPRSSLRTELNVSRTTKIITFAGLLVKRKGIRKILKIAHMMRKEDVCFVLVGDGPGRAQYEREAHHLSNVHFLGWRKDMTNIYAGTDIFLLPAEGEGLPGVIMEAMSYGVPCVASNIPCIPDLITHGTSGYVCDKDDSAAFAKHLRILARNMLLRRRMGANARRKIAQFSWHRIVPKYQRMYKDVLA